MSDLLSWLGTPSATSSPASECGATPFDWLDGPTTSPSGRGAVPANLSARQAKELGLLTSATFGPHGSISSSSALLASSLVSRLRARTASLGSTLYTLTWKERVTPSQRSIFALRASGLRTSDSGLGSWPTPTTRDFRDVCNLSTSMYRPAGKLRKDVLPRVLWLHRIGFGSPTQEQMDEFATCLPVLARSLMGLPSTWDDCAPTVTRSSRRSLQNSSARTESFEWLR